MDSSKQFSDDSDVRGLQCTWNSAVSTQRFPDYREISCVEDCPMIYIDPVTGCTFLNSQRCLYKLYYCWSLYQEQDNCWPSLKHADVLFVVGELSTAIRTLLFNKVQQIDVGTMHPGCPYLIYLVSMQLDLYLTSPVRAVAQESSHPIASQRGRPISSTRRCFHEQHTGKKTTCTWQNDAVSFHPADATISGTCRLYGPRPQNDKP